MSIRRLVLMPLVLPVLALLAVQGCAGSDPGAQQADLVVVGAGMAGLAAALEAAAAGARVIVVDSNSVGGGHAILASGFSLVGTPLQEKMGYKDDVETAVADMLAWGEDADPWWVRRYAEASRSEVHDWLVNKGVQFAMILPNPEDSVPRFHLPRGAAAHAVLPVLREALADEHISFLWRHEATRLLQEGGRVTGVHVRDLQHRGEINLHAAAVIIATGGFESNEQLVREHWPSTKTLPDTLLIGAGQFATGGGLELATAVGAALTRMDRQLIYVTGMPSPRDSTGKRGLLALNPAAIMVDAQGHRFINEAGPAKDIESHLLAQDSPGHWLVFDEAGREQLMIRGGPWLTGQLIEDEIMTNPGLVSQAPDIVSLAKAAGLPGDALTATVARYNSLVEAGEDTDHQRFGDTAVQVPSPALETPPFYAIQLFPMTRKSMGGLAVDHDARVLDESGQPIDGLYAAGEVTGIAGLNGSHGGSGTFLGPSLLMGRIAGQTAVGEMEVVMGVDEEQKESRWAAMLGTASGAQELAESLAQGGSGTWHFAEVHRMVLKAGENCQGCHVPPWTTGPAHTREQQLLQAESCVRCH